MIFNCFFSTRWIIMTQEVQSHFSPQMRPHQMSNVIIEPDDLDRPVFSGVADVTSNLPPHIVMDRSRGHGGQTVAF